METPALAVASSDTSSWPSALSTSDTSWASTLFLLEREDEEPLILATVTLDDGLGLSFSLGERGGREQQQSEGTAKDLDFYHNSHSRWFLLVLHWRLMVEAY